MNYQIKEVMGLMQFSAMGSSKKLFDSIFET